jgi:hypothetical protein
MPSQFLTEQFKAGDRLDAKTINRLIEAANKIHNLTASNGMSVLNGRHGIHLRGDTPKDDLSKCLLTSSGTAPPYSVCCVDQAVTLDAHRNEGVIRIRKPNTIFCRNLVVLTSSGLAQDTTGKCIANDGSVCIVKYEENGSIVPRINEMWGVKPNQYEIARGFPGFTVLGMYSVDNRLVIVKKQSIDELLVKTVDSVLASSATNSFKIYAGGDGPGTETDAGYESGYGKMPDAYNRGPRIGASKFALLKYLPSGPIINALECTAATDP